MTDEVISPLRRRMLDAMAVRNFSDKKRHDYIRHIKNFTAFLGRSPDSASADDLHRFQLHQRRNGVQSSSMNSAVSALRVERKCWRECSSRNQVPAAMRRRKASQP